MKNLPRSVSLGISIALLSLGAATNAWPQAFTDLTNRFAVAKSGLVLNRATNTFNSLVTLTNVSNAPINGSLVLLVSNISAGSVTLANKSGQSAAGIPYVTLPMPAGGIAPGAALSNIVLAFSNPTRISFTFNLSVAVEGVLLSGDPQMLAGSGIFNLPAVGVDATQIQGRVILTRLELRLTPNATVQDVNSALLKVGGVIVSMSAGDLGLTISVPRQASLSALRQLAAVLKGQPGISSARPAFAAQPLTLTQDGSETLDPSALREYRFLMPARFPAAINVGTSRAGLGPLLDPQGKCKVAPVVILLADAFGATPGPILAALVPFAPPNTPGSPAPPAGSVEADHGYLTGGVIGATNPFWDCLDVVPVQSFGMSGDEATRALASSMSGIPAQDKFIASRSMGFHPCDTDPCIAPDGNMELPSERAEDTLTWKKLTHSRWGDFLMVNSAGNSGDSDAARIYPGLGQAAYGSEAAISESSDPFFSFVTENRLWDPLVPVDGHGDPFLSVVADPADVTALTNDVNAAGLSGTDSVENNVLVVGSSTNEPRTATQTAFVPPEQLSESLFSNAGSDVLAVGENDFDPGFAPDPTNQFATGFQGTSFAAPQVAGLASYLWLLSSDLRDNQPIEKTRQAILQNRRGNGIDAYATVLSLDQAVPPTSATAPVRVALLDVNGDSLFDEKDIDNILRFLYFVDGSGTITHDSPANTQADFSRYDLNGDGFTTSSSSHRERFDLDRVGSVQYGATNYSKVTQIIEGQTVNFDETDLTDVEILCYYAYSPLYAGNFDARKNLLDGRCGLSVSPKTVTLTSGQTQQFSALPASIAVTWSSTCGSINSSTGLYTAGNTGGSCTVSATSTADAGVSATATVTVTVPSTVTLSGDITWSRDNTSDDDEPFNGTLIHIHDDFHTRISVSLTVVVKPDWTTIVSASGTATARETLSNGFCGAPPNVVLTGARDYSLDETIVSGRFLNSPLPVFDGVLWGLSLFGSGTQTQTRFTANCAPFAETTTVPLGPLGSVFGGVPVGRPVFQNGQLVAIDFNRVDGTFTGTGQLVKQP